jgi:hypothetical protein
METDTTSEHSVMVSPHAPIDELGISIRTFNALKRYSNIDTVADLIRLVEAGQLREVRNIGTLSITEIEDILSHVRLTEPIKTKDDASRGYLDNLVAETEVLRAENANLLRHLRQLAVVQASAVRRQLASGLLHKDALVMGKSIADWLELVGRAEVGSVIAALSAILESSTNVCDELAYAFDQTSTRDLTVLLSRYGGVVRTLDEIGKDMNLTRERVRQICVRLAEEVEVATIGSRSTTIAAGMPAKDLPIRPPLVRLQSALLRAKDMGLDISYAAWKEDILTSGLVGRLQPSNLRGFDPVELMLATCSASCDSKKNGLVHPG